MYGAIISLVVGLGIAGTVYFGFNSWVSSIEQRGAVKQMQADAEVLKQCKEERDRVAANNATLSANYETLRERVQEASKAVDAVASVTKDVLKQKDRGLAEQQGKIAAIEADRKAALARAEAFKEAGDTCEQTLVKVGTAMRELAARELRDRPATEAPSDAPGKLKVR